MMSKDLKQSWCAESILAVLDRCAQAYTFPMLDNGYCYLAASRLHVFRSANDWSLVIEIFGYECRAGEVCTDIYSFGSNLQGRPTESQFETPEAYAAFMGQNPYNELAVADPCHGAQWVQADDEAYVPVGAELAIRGHDVGLPNLADCLRYGVQPTTEGRLTLFEACRWLAGKYRRLVLASDEEARVNIAEDMVHLLTLEEWQHPDIAGDELPSQAIEFQQLAKLLAGGDLKDYQPSDKPNTHWRHWPHLY